MEIDWPLVGRSSELRQLTRLVTAPAAGAAVLVGPSGVGKTRLAREWLEVAERAGLAPLWVAATRSAVEVPFGAFAAVLPSVSPRPLDPPDDRSEFLRRTVAALVERAGDRRLALVVDDAHLLDDPSAMVVHQLVVTKAAIVLATVRSGEPVPDPVLSLWKDDLAARIELRGLNAEAIEELLGSALGAQIDAAAVAQLAVRCEGNVLFLRELVIGAVEDGTLREDAGVWRVTGPLSPSERLVELVETRLGSLSGEERNLLELVSYGEPVGSAELTAFNGRDLAVELERKGLLASRLNKRRLEVRLAHPLYGDVLRSRMPALRTTAVAASLAGCIEATGARRREDTLRVAVWRLDVGGARPELMLAAATASRWRFDFPLAERLAEAALELGAGFEAGLLLAQLEGLRGHAAEAERRLAELVPADASQRARVAITRMDNLVFCLGRHDVGLAVAEEAEAAITDPNWVDEIAARRAGVVLATRGPRACAAAAEPVVRRAQGRALSWASMAAAFSWGRLGRIQAALDTAAMGHQANLALVDPMEWYPWFHLFLRCEALAHAGRFEEADALASEQYHLGLEAGSSEARAYFAWHLGRSAEARGHAQRAARQTREAITLFRELGRSSFVQSTLPHLALALALAGHPQEAAKALRSAELQDAEPPLWSGVDVPIARAWTAAMAGDLGEARQSFEVAASAGQDMGDLVGAATALHGLARIGHAQESVSRLAELAGEVEGGLVQARQAHAAGLVARDPSALSEVSRAFEDLGAGLLGAEAAADAAVAWRRRGEHKKAAPAERRAADLAAACEQPSTPALASVGARARLTQAERETALLAVAGHSSKEIAELQILSVRTVDNRLQRVYQKLGISSRSELADALE